MCHSGLIDAPQKGAKAFSPQTFRRRCRSQGAYGDSLMSLADVLRQRLAGPHAAQVVELSELAIAGAEKSLEQIDDSGGGVMPAILALASVHLDACKQTGPDPMKLAERLFRLQAEGGWDTF
jgi:nitroreductase